MGWNISKEFSFCYGHRVWSQQLNSEYSLESSCKCRHLHGHEGLCIVHLPGDTLTNGMVTDFKHLGWFKKWIDDTLDHKFIIDRNDPLFYHELPHLKTGEIFLRKCNADIGPDTAPYFNLVVDKLNTDIPSFILEKYEGMVVVNFVPTSENISKWLFDIVSYKMGKIGVKVSEVELYETPKSRSSYRGT